MKLRKYSDNDALAVTNYWLLIVVLAVLSRTMNKVGDSLLRFILDNLNHTSNNNTSVINRIYEL
ncbi:hypothetical protein NIES23_10600 [Trichormus variabilis NIES-23]|uniref:Uncharacterized protein n=1 Tax=Trichormus variabilis NIES-23 TaxID=1973479 RepID=A0A1Z4KH17_ANAVA|nr:hypothetical protein NIES23_10600 [Trichormus variabilis NIES-23]